MWVYVLRGVEVPLGVFSTGFSAYAVVAREVISDLTLISALLVGWLTVCLLGWRIVALRLKLKHGRYDEID